MQEAKAGSLRKVHPTQEVVEARVGVERVHSNPNIRTGPVLGGQVTEERAKNVCNAYPPKALKGHTPNWTNQAGPSPACHLPQRCRQYAPTQRTGEDRKDCARRDFEWYGESVIYPSILLMLELMSQTVDGTPFINQIEVDKKN